MKKIITVESVYDKMNKKLEFRTLSEILNDKSVPPEPIIGNGILLPQTLLQIVGSKKVGKSFLTYEIACLLCNGKSSSIFKVKKAYKIMLLSAEGGKYPNRDRLQKMMERFTEYKENLKICFNSRIKLDNEDDITILKESIKEYKPDILIIDPLVRFHSKDENSANEMAEVLGTLRDLIEEFNLAIILVHHLGKNENNGPRGSSVIEGEYDSCITMTGNMKNTIKCSFDVRHVETPEDIKIKFNKDTLWFELDAKEISPVVQILLEEGPKTKSEFAKRIVELGIRKNISNAYKPIDAAFNNEEIMLNDDEYYYV